jgi:hypothetical protein
VRSCASRSQSSSGVSARAIGVLSDGLAAAADLARRRRCNSLLQNFPEVAQSTDALHTPFVTKLCSAASHRRRSISTARTRENRGASATVWLPFPQSGVQVQECQLLSVCRHASRVEWAAGIQSSRSAGGRCSAPSSAAHSAALVDRKSSVCSHMAADGLENAPSI